MKLRPQYNFSIFQSVSYSRYNSRILFHQNLVSSMGMSMRNISPESFKNVEINISYQTGSIYSLCLLWKIETN